MRICTLSKHIPSSVVQSKTLSHTLRPNAPRARPFTTQHSSTTTSQTELDTTRHEALTLQHKAENLLEVVFKIGERPSDVRRTADTQEFWRDVLSDTFENLSTAAERPARVVVIGADEWSGAENLVTALLEEPLSSIQEQEDALRNRWKTASPSNDLTISTSPNGSLSSIHLSSSYLLQFSVPLEITELRSSSPLSTSSQPQLPTTFFKADVPIIVFNPLTTPLHVLESLDVPSHTILVASETSNLNNTSLQRSTQAQLLPQSSHDDSPRVLFVDSSRAISAIQSFRSNPTSTFAIQQYQDNFTNSGISLVTKAIRDIVDLGANTSSPAAHLRNRTALIQLYNVLNAFSSSIKDVQRNLDDIREGISQLTGRAEEAKVREPNDILRPNGPEPDVVGESLRLASKEMREVLEKLNWWKSIWRVDEISGIVGAAVDRVWCKDLEKKLILQTGCLRALQKQFTTSATNLATHQSSTSSKSPPPRYPLFTACILENTLSQLVSSLTYTLTPSSLTSPITKRKSQLLAYPTTRLHVKAQQLVFGMSTGVAGGSGLTWAGWMGYLVQSAGETGSGIWSVVGMGMDPTTGIGLGLLGVVGSMRWAVGKWEKEKRRWWADWERIGQGLERDLKTRVDVVMKEQVTVAADTACRGLAELCDKRQEEVDKVEDDVSELQTELKTITSRTQA